jgi:hypothetical protein
MAETGGERWERRYRESMDRAERMQQQYEGTRPWSGSSQDYEDVLGPERSGGIDKVVSGPKVAGRRTNGDDYLGPSVVRATPKPNGGNGLSGGAALKMPTSVGSDW